jgi:hypothetical protein
MSKIDSHRLNMQARPAQHVSGWWFGSKIGGKSGWFAEAFTTGTSFHPTIRKGRRRNRNILKKRESLVSVNEDGAMDFCPRSFPDPHTPVPACPATPEARH